MGRRCGAETSMSPLVSQDVKERERMSRLERFANFVLVFICLLLIRKIQCCVDILEIIIIL